jgi:hypothetical protein
MNKTPGSVHFLHVNGKPSVCEAKIDGVLVQDCVWRAVLGADGKYPWQAVRRVEVLEELNRYMGLVNGLPESMAQAESKPKETVPVVAVAKPVPAVAAASAVVPNVAPPAPKPFAKAIARATKAHAAKDAGKINANKQPANRSAGSPFAKTIERMSGGH